MSATVCIHHHGLTDATDRFGMDADEHRSQLAAALARVAGGDRAALRIVYQDTSAKLFGVCLRILNDRSEAEDVLQDVYVTVWRKAGTFDPGRASPITWLVAIARNRSIDKLRGGAAGRRLEPIENAEAVSDPAPAAVEVLEQVQENAQAHNLPGRTRGAPRHRDPRGLHGRKHLRGTGQAHGRAPRHDEKLGAARTTEAESLSGEMSEDDDHIAPEDEQKLVAAEYVLGVLDGTDRRDRGASDRAHACARARRRGLGATPRQPRRRHRAGRSAGADLGPYRSRHRRAAHKARARCRPRSVAKPVVLAHLCASARRHWRPRALRGSLMSVSLRHRPRARP